MSAISACELRSTVEAQLGAIECAGTFYGSGNWPGIHPGLSIQGIGRFGSPLYERDVRALIEAGRQEVSSDDERNYWILEGKMDPDQISFTNPKWTGFEAQILQDMCIRLGIPGGAENVRAELHKLHIDREGAVIRQLWSEELEKPPGTFATLMIGLPSLHEGGDIVVSFGSEGKRLLPRLPRNGAAPIRPGIPMFSTSSSLSSRATG